jgi:OmpA-OmpF porin, OOP family
MKLVLRAVLAISLFALGTSAFAAGAGKKGYLVDSQNDVVRSGFGLCWHTGFWTPADAIEECDGSIAKPAAVASAYLPAAPAQVSAPAVENITPAAAAAPTPTAEKVTYSADAFFDFDKACAEARG